jgi:hypothetical protein
MGVLLDDKGNALPNQVWGYANQFIVQLENKRLAAKATPGDFNVWFPGAVVNSLGVPNTGQFPNGAFLSFKTEADAQAHIRARGGWGVVLDQKGDPAATQPWNQSGQYVAQLTNAKLTTAPAKGEYAVWFPAQYLSSLGSVANPTQFQATGAYLSFKTEAEAQAHAKARGWGVILDPTGAGTATQTWGTANQFVVQLLNPKLSPKPVKGEFNVWFPQQYVGNLGLGTGASQFTAGAYLGFKTEADAQAHVRQRGNWGVILDDKGKLATNQIWNQANQFGAQLLNDQLTATRTKGKFSVWFPQQYVPSLGTTNTSGFNAGAYLAFDTLADAQAHARARNMGVVLNDQGGYDQTQQTWAYAAQMQTQLLNAEAKPQRINGKYNVWFPQQYLGNVGMNPAGFNGGAYIAFNSAAEAQAHARARGLGVILDDKGAVDGTQTWPQATQFVAQLTNAQLTAQRTKGQYAVWFPQQYLGNIGVSTPANFPGGAFLSFPTQAEAQNHVKARGNVGVILDDKGNPDATQLWTYANQMVAQLRNGDLVQKQPAGKYAVWFPQNILGNIGISAPASYPAGAYLAFDSLADATAHAKLRGNMGAILDPDGSYDASQVWAQANAFMAQKLNAQFQPNLVPGKYNVWFPANIFPNVGFTNPGNFNGGAYLAFNSKQEAVDHVKNRANLGVIVDDKGQTAPFQLWPSALQMAASNTTLKPPPPSGWVSGPVPADPATAAKLGNPTAGSVAITGITPTKGGADVTAYVASIRAPDSFKFSVGGQVNGNWMAIFAIPDLMNVAGPGWNQYTIHVDYDAIDAYLKGVNPALGITTDMGAAIGIKFTSGHDTGIPGWSSNTGTERDALTKLPAKAP